MTYTHRSSHTDQHLVYINRVLVGCSMTLSGWFGWMLGENLFPLNLVLALMCAAVAMGVSILFERAAMYNVMGLTGNAMVCWVIGCLFLAFNTIADYSSAAALRDAVSVKATNANNRANDVRSQIEIVKKNIADAKATVAWQSSLQPPASYEAEISNLEGNRTIMDRSKNCFDQTRPDTKAHCEKLSAARANLAMAQQKMTYETQVAKWETELGQLATKSLEAETHTNPAIAQVKSFMAWATGRLDISDDQVAWGQLGIMALMTILVNAGLAFLGNELGTQRALYQQAVYSGDMPEPAAREPARIAYHGRPSDPPRAVHEPDPPVPLKPAPGSNRETVHRETSKETVILAPQMSVDGELPGDSTDVRELVKRAQEASDDVLRRLREMKAQGSA